MSKERCNIERLFRVLALLGASACSVPAQTAAPISSAPYSLKLAASVVAGFDSNLFLQDVDPDPAIAGSVKAKQESFFTTLIVNAGVDYKLSPSITAGMTWQSEATFFSEESSEDHKTQRAAISLSGKTGATTWSIQNSITHIDGSDVGPIWGGPGGAAGMGGVAVRERRDAFVNRGLFRLRHQMGRWWVRPTMTTYYHDWRTEQSRATGYQNYVDREDWMAGADVGWALGPKADVFVGVRRGRQDQRKLFAVDSPYDSHVVRWLAGFEGTVVPGVQCMLAFGPEFHHWINSKTLPAAFDQDKFFWWIDANVTYSPTPKDAIILSNKRFPMSTFGGVAYFEDITYDIAWKHKVDDQLNYSLSFRAYGGTFTRPTLRQDYIFTPAAQVQYKFDKNSSMEANYLFDRADSRLHNTSGREYHRSVGSLAYKYTF